MSPQPMLMRAALVAMISLAAAHPASAAPASSATSTLAAAPALRAPSTRAAAPAPGAARGKAAAGRRAAASDARDGGADAVEGGAPSPATANSPSPGTPEPPRTWPSCSEHLPSGASRPALKERFPSRGTSGYASVLEVVVEHGKGETVLPQGFRLQSSSEAARAFGEAGFIFPDPDGGAGPTLVTTPTASGATTSISLPVLVLPKTPGRNAMTLPPVPIAIARASGELVTVCTQAHNIVVDDPTSSTPDALPRPNPPVRSQLEEWTLAKQLTIGALIGAVVAALAAWLIARWMKRPKPVPPPPPPRPPWDVALEELFAVRHAGLVQQARFAEHYDRISDAVRKYLGGRYGFDGLETTTREMTSLLRRIEPPVVDLPVIFGFLEECDLVKFARFTPSDEDCGRVLDQAEHIVRATTPRELSAVAASPSRRPATGGAR